MLTVTEKAVEVIADFLKDKKTGAAIRVFLNVECSVPILGMTLDDANTDADEVISTGGTTFIVKKELFNQVKPINIDFIITPTGAVLN
jgi:Fe-S cluster assembly iron-binding protein IscA